MKRVKKVCLNCNMNIACTAGLVCNEGAIYKCWRCRRLLYRIATGDSVRDYALHDCCSKFRKSRSKVDDFDLELTKNDFLGTLKRRYEGHDMTRLFLHEEILNSIFVFVSNRVCSSCADPLTAEMTKEVQLWSQV